MLRLVEAPKHGLQSAVKRGTKTLRGAAFTSPSALRKRQRERLRCVVTELTVLAGIGGGRAVTTVELRCGFRSN